MAFNDLVRVLWQRKLLILLVTVGVIGASYGATKLITPQYESTATLALSPKNLNNDLIFFGTLDAIVPVYADAATSRTTLLTAQGQAGGSLGNITVETFKGTGLIKIKARSTSPDLAQRSAEAVASTLLDRTNSGEIGIPSLRLTMLDQAGLPTTPVFPRTRLTLLVGTLLGLALGIGAALLRENLTTRVETADDLSRNAGVPVFAEIPAESAVLKMKSPDDLVTDARLRVVAEALRDLRTNLLFSDDSIRSIVVTSPDGSHGKTTVSFGLASTLARAGTRTLLIDGDLRRGRVAQMLEIPRAPGLAEVLLENASLEESIRSTESDTLDVLPAGGHAGDPGELLTQEFPALLARLEQQYDAIVVDSTPVIPVSDARVTARYADATVLVARAGQARRRQVRAAVERLGLISVRPTAAVLNHSREVSESSYYIRPTPEAAEQRAARRARTRGAARG